MDLFSSIDDRLAKNCDVISCLDLVKNYDFNKYLDLFQIKSNNKNYYKNIIYKNNVFELVLIKWDKDSETNIHSHPENGCLLKPISGKIKEIRYLNNQKEEKTDLKINEVYYMHDKIGKHKIIANESSYSIHLYSPPNFYN